MAELVESGKSWAKQIAEYYGQGYSDAEVAAELKITIKEYYQQMADNPVFAQLVEYGRTLALAFWEGQLRKNLNNKTFNTAGWKYWMANKYGWSEKTETNNNNENVNTNLDDLREKVLQQVAKFIKTNSPELTDAKKLIESLQDGGVDGQ